MKMDAEMAIVASSDADSHAVKTHVKCSSSHSFVDRDIYVLFICISIRQHRKL